MYIQNHINIPTPDIARLRIVICIFYHVDINSQPMFRPQILHLRIINCIFPHYTHIHTKSLLALESKKIFSLWISCPLSHLVGLNWAHMIVCHWEI